MSTRTAAVTMMTAAAITTKMTMRIIIQFNSLFIYVLSSTANGQLIIITIIILTIIMSLLISLSTHRTP
jgi:hypothetical protein